MTSVRRFRVVCRSGPAWCRPTLCNKHVASWFTSMQAHAHILFCMSVNSRAPQRPSIENQIVLLRCILWQEGKGQWPRQPSALRHTCRYLKCKKILLQRNLALQAGMRNGACKRALHCRARGDAPGQAAQSQNCHTRVPAMCANLQPVKIVCNHAQACCSATAPRLFKADAFTTVTQNK